MARKNNPFETKIFRKEEVKDARKWFRDKLASIKGVSLKGIDMSDLRYRGKAPLEGRMVYYAYKAKYDGKLPYWDKFPLIIVLSENAKYISGLNLHYLPPSLRGIFLSRLMDVINNDRFDRTSKFNATYEILKAASKYRYFKPCIKLYLKKQIRSNIMIIRPQMWHKAIWLPVANFKGASTSEVWQDSKASYSR